MWFLAINGLAYFIYGLVSGRFRERLFPIRPAEVLQTIVETLHFKAQTQHSCHQMDGRTNSTS